MTDRRRTRALTPEEVDAIDPAFIDSVAGDRLIATIREREQQMKFLARQYAAYVHMQVALVCADLQGELKEAAEWVVNGADQWLSAADLAKDPWAHDWRRFWNSRDSITGEPAKECGICGAPATIWNSDLAACDRRHWDALHGCLPDEQCRLCNEVRVCAHELAGSPVCADCWPGERLLAERRAAWKARFDPPEPVASTDANEDEGREA